MYPHPIRLDRIIPKYLVKIKNFGTTHYAFFPPILLVFTNILQHTEILFFS